MPPKPQRTSSTQPSVKQAAPRLEALPPAYFFAPDVEREINRLDSVTSARVMSTGAEIDEIHVISPPDRPPKKIVRDIESLLLVRFGIRIDHRCISIVQMEGAQTAYPQNTRPRIVEVTNADGVARVHLAVGDKLILGESRPVDGHSEIEAIGRAVIHAVEQLLQTPGVLGVLETQVVQMHACQIVMVLVRWLFADQHELLIGASVVNADPFEATARATLDAVNRRLVRLQTARA